MLRLLYCTHLLPQHLSSCPCLQPVGPGRGGRAPAFASIVFLAAGQLDRGAAQRQRTCTSAAVVRLLEVKNSSGRKGQAGRWGICPGQPCKSQLRLPATLRPKLDAVEALDQFQRRVFLVLHFRKTEADGKQEEQHSRPGMSPWYGKCMLSLGCPVRPQCFGGPWITSSYNLPGDTLAHNSCTATAHCLLLERVTCSLGTFARNRGLGWRLIQRSTSNLTSAVGRATGYALQK